MPTIKNSRPLLMFQEIRLALWLALKELKNQKVLSLIIVLNLSLGLFAFAAIDTFRSAFDQKLQSQSKQLAGGDIIISSSSAVDPQSLIDWQRNHLGADKVATSSTLFSMVSHQENSRLVSLQALSTNYPIYGSFRGEQHQNLGAELGPGRVAVDPELAQQLEISIGDRLNVGALSFEVIDIVVEDSSQGGQGFNVAPRLYLSQSDLEGTELVRFGSRVQYRYFFAFENLDDRSIRDRLKESRGHIQELIQGSIRFRDDEASEMGMLTRYVSDFLALSSLIGVMLAGIGSLYLLRIFVQNKIFEVAVLRCLGFRPSFPTLTFVIQIMVLSAFSALMSLALVLGLSQGVLTLVDTLVAEPVAVQLSMRTSVNVLMITLGNVFVFALPSLWLVHKLRPAILLRSSEVGGQGFALLQVLAVTMFFAVLAFVQSRSVVMTLVFVAGVLALVVMVFVVARGFLAVMGFLLRLKIPLGLRLSSTYLVRNPLMTSVALVALVIVTVLLAIPSQIQNGLRQEIAVPSDELRPDLFLFDIQDEQLEPLQELLRVHGKSLYQTSPLVRARLLAINGEAVVERESDSSSFQTREDQQQAAFRSRNYNLSSRSELTSSETVFKGHYFSGKYDWGEHPFGISVEQRFAARMSLGIGDLMTFDIQGVEATGVVESIRKIRWTSFYPNFFVTLQPGVLDEAPKSFVSAIAGLAATEKAKLQLEIVRAFPNVSVIDVSNTVGRILQLADQLEKILVSMAVAIAMCGLLVIASIAYLNARRRQSDFAVMRSLGFGFGQLGSIVVGEFMILWALSALVAVFACWGFNLALGQYVFSGAFDMGWKTIFWSLAASLSVMLVVAWSVIRLLKSYSPAYLLRES